MLHALVEYATNQGLVIEPGFKAKNVRWAILFAPDRTAGVLGVQELGEVGERGNRGRLFKRCPDLSQPEMKAGGPGCRHFLVDSAEVVTLLAQERLDAPAQRKLKAKHDYFVGLLRRASAAVPQLRLFADRLADSEAIRAIQEQLRAARAKPTDNVTLAVMDSGVRFVVEETSWHEWWRGFRTSLAQGKGRGKRQAEPVGARMRCFASGELVQPASTHPKIEGLADVGGLSMGDALASFKQDAFRSYGLQQSANAAVSEEMAAAYRAALNDLIREQGRRVGAVKVVHWYSGKVPPEKDPLAEIEQGEQAGDDWEEEPVAPQQEEAEAQHRARVLVRSYETAEDAKLLSYRFYVLALSGAAGRVMVRDWFEGRFEELRKNRDAWFNDLAIVHRSGEGPARKPKFLAVLGALVRDLDDLTAPMTARLWRVAVRNEPIPHLVMTQALARVKIDVVQDAAPNHARFGLLKAYHRRQGDQLMGPHLNEDHPHPAYHCGRLMAVLADIQYAALPHVGAGVVQRYYAAASATPALVLGRLTRTAQFHLAAIKDRRRPLLDERMTGIWASLKDTVPAVLTLEEQSLFALGYYHQKASPRKDRSSDVQE